MKNDNDNNDIKDEAILEKECKQQIKQKIQTLILTLQATLAEYQLQSIQQMAHILINPQLSQLFKQKYPSFQSVQYSSNNLSQRLKQLAIQHTYHQMYIYYQQFPIYMQQCKTVLRHKYQVDDILRTHQNRKSIWLLCSGALQRIKQNPIGYQKMTEYRSSYPQFYKHTIEKDVVRTVHDKNKQGQQTLSSILRNFAIHNPYIGYRQGMNFIVNFLIIMQFTQQEAYWLTVQLLQEFLPKTYYTNMMGVAIDICIIEHYIKINSPALFNKLTEMNLSLSLFILEWLVCLFTSTLPFYMLVIVWDMMFIYGPSVLLKVCLVILEQLEDSILNTDDLCTYANYLEQLKEDQFIKRISKINIDQALLPLCRQLVEFKLTTEKVELNQNTKPKKKAHHIECNIQWPICYHALRQHKSDMGQIEVWTFKQQGPPKIINDYLLIKNKKGFKPIQDNRTQQKRLHLGRIPHCCDFKEYNKKQKINEELIELEEFNFMNRRMLVDNLSILTSKFQNQNLTNMEFYKRAESQNFSFWKISKLQSDIERRQKQIKIQEKNTQQLQKNNILKEEDIKNNQNQQTHEIQKIQDSSLNKLNQPDTIIKKSRNPFKRLRSKLRQRKNPINETEKLLINQKDHQQTVK